MNDLRPWFALQRVPGVGNLLFRRLVVHFGTPQAVLDADQADLGAVPGVNARLAAAVRHHRPDDPAVTRLLETIHQKGYRIATQADPAYPQLLLEIPDPPPLLYILGNLPKGKLTIAMVGSRNATGYGITTTRRLAADLARQQVIIVSGMARGVDTAAHSAAMAAGGMTVAVLGTGLDRIYPRENERLYHQIADHGAVVSEFPLGTGPDAHHFPARNRIISGMCHGTVVVEATGRSGSLITARLAAEQNREVFAVPGNVHSFKSVGTHGLIKDGAKLVMHAGDILDEFSGWQHGGPVAETPAAAPVPPLTDTEAMVMDKLEADPIHIDDLARQLTLPAGRLSGILLQLELKGLVDQSPGKRFALAPGLGRTT
jgi:DNA processing protein